MLDIANIPIVMQAEDDIAVDNLSKLYIYILRNISYEVKQNMCIYVQLIEGITL